MPRYYQSSKGYKRRRGYGSRRYQGKSSYKKKRMQSALSSLKKVVASNAQDFANMETRGRLGIELKYLDTQLAGSISATTADLTLSNYDPAVLLCLNGIAQGSGSTERDGRQVKVLSIQIDGHIEVSPSAVQYLAGEGSPFVKVILVRDRSNNGTATQPAGNVVFNSTGDADTNVHARPNLDYSRRFDILATKTVNLADNTLMYDSAAPRYAQRGRRFPFRIYKRVNDVVNHKGITGNLGDIVDVAYHLFVLRSNGFTSISTLEAPQINYVSRVRFVG